MSGPGRGRPARHAAAAVDEQVAEASGQVMGPGDVRAGDPDVKQLLNLLVREGLARAHDPRGDAARAGDVGADRLGRPLAEFRQVASYDQDAAGVATLADLVEQPGALVHPAVNRLFR
jgi:hypothetical protein